MKYKAGSLVTARHRDWIVLPSNDNNLVLLKPLGGSEEEVTGIYLPLAFDEDEIKSANFPCPKINDIGDIGSARLLYNAARLSFRNGAGPFRCLAKLSFRPRSYQMVPLIMALKQPFPIRLLISDDVGVGKTVEALIILKELLERREIKRFAIIVLPHLCEQWQAELKDKFGIDAVIIRSNTQAALDREIQGDTSVYDYYPYQIISIDFIKSEQRRQVFIQDCPEFVIVDEAHTCTEASGTSVSQQRYRLIKDISAKPNQHLILMTATPHSGKNNQFSSLLGLIKKEYESYTPEEVTQSDRRELAKYYVQRRRADVEKWMNEDTPFPKRNAGEVEYDLSIKYSEFYDDILEFSMGLTRGDELHEGRKKLRYWSALALLRGVMSSPEAGVEMLKNRLRKKENSTEDDQLPLEENNPLMDEDYGYARDHSPNDIINRTDWTEKETRRLRNLAEKLESLKGIDTDHKAKKTLSLIKEWIKEGYNPVIFCRFIATANYIGDILKSNLKKGIDVQVVTSEDPDEVRKQRIDTMKNSSVRVLVATDCLSEGINLQDLFTAVLHYDLPWNPNRLEQREGRIDRYGQVKEDVKAYLLYGTNNPIDGVVLKVLLRKVREIRKATGISIPFPEDSQTLMDSVLQAVLVSRDTKEDRKQPKQLLLFDIENLNKVKESEIKVTHAIEAAAEREKASRNIFAQNAIKASEIEEDLKQSDEAIGNPEAVEAFVTEALTSKLGVQITKESKGKGYRLYKTNMPEILENTLPKGDPLNVTFFSPTPEGYVYLGRNHLFVEQLCQYLLGFSLNGDTDKGPARAAIIRCQDVAIKTTLLLFRVRNVIEEKKGGKQIIAEEMLTWGFKGDPEDQDILSESDVKKLMMETVPSSPLSVKARESFFQDELEEINEFKKNGVFDNVAYKRSEILIEAHDRFRKVLGGTSYKVVTPVLPMDLMGIYILLPDNRKA